MMLPAMIRVVLVAVALTAGVSQAQEAPAQPEFSIWDYWEPRPKPPEQSPYGFSVEYGQDRNTGQTQLDSRNGRFSLRYDNGLDEVKFEGDGSYVKSGTYMIDNRRHTYFGYDRYLASRVWLFLLNDWETNEPIGLKSAQMTGGGLKYDFLRNSFWKLNGGLAYLKRSRHKISRAYDTSGNIITSDRVDDDRVLSYRLKFSMTTQRMAFSLLAFYQPVIGKKMDTMTGKDVVDYNTSIDAGLSYFVSEKLYIRFGHYYRYEAIRLAPDQEKWQQRNYLSFGYAI